MTKLSIDVIFRENTSVPGPSLVTIVMNWGLISVQLTRNGYYFLAAYWYHVIVIHLEAISFAFSSVDNLSARKT